MEDEVARAALRFPDGSRLDWAGNNLPRPGDLVFIRSGDQAGSWSVTGVSWLIGYFDSGLKAVVYVEEIK